MTNKRRTHRLSPRAVTDLEEIWIYTCGQWSLVQAEEYHRDIMAAVEGAASGSKLGQIADAREGYWKYKVGMHIVYFRCSDDSLDVIRILHGRMDVDMQL